MRALILGARGMLGRQLCDTLRDFSLTCWDKEELDLVDEMAVRERIVGQRPDVIINAAAYTDVDGAETHRDEALAVNAQGVAHIAHAAKDVGAQVVHFSTDYVFSGNNEDGYAENDPPGPAVNVYGESKLAGERALKEIGPEFYLVRTSWLYGPGSNNFVDTMLRLAKERDTLTVVDDQHGSPTLAKDVAKATAALLSDDTFAPGIYHAVNAGSTTWRGFAEEIFRLADVTVTVEPVTSAEYPLPAARPSYGMLKNTRGPQLRSWQAALKEYIEGLATP